MSIYHKNGSLKVEGLYASVAKTRACETPEKQKAKNCTGWTKGMWGRCRPCRMKAMQERAHRMVHQYERQELCKDKEYKATTGIESVDAQFEKLKKMGL